MTECSNFQICHLINASITQASQPALRAPDCSPEERALSTSPFGIGVPSPRNPSIPLELFLKEIIQSELPRARLALGPPRLSLTAGNVIDYIPATNCLPVFLPSFNQSHLSSKEGKV